MDDFLKKLEEKGIVNLNEEELFDYLFGRVLRDIYFVDSNSGANFDEAKLLEFKKGKDSDYLSALMVANYFRWKSEQKSPNQKFCHNCGTKLLGYPPKTSFK